MTIEVGNTASGLLGVLFIGLKLTGFITWSWWLVTAPLWAPIALLILVACIAVIIASIA
jgi:hypothetical protein